jgi:hypothetical protein
LLGVFLGRQKKPPETTGKGHSSHKFVSKAYQQASGVSSWSSSSPRNLRSVFSWESLLGTRCPRILRGIICSYVAFSIPVEQTYAWRWAGEHSTIAGGAPAPSQQWVKTVKLIAMRTISSPCWRQPARNACLLMMLYSVHGVAHAEMRVTRWKYSSILYRLFCGYAVTSYRLFSHWGLKYVPCSQSYRPIPNTPDRVNERRKGNGTNENESCW